MKYTALINGKPFTEVEPVTPVPATFEYTPDDLAWEFNSDTINGRYDLRVDGEYVKPWIAGQTGEIELTNGELIKFTSVKKEAR